MSDLLMSLVNDYNLLKLFSRLRQAGLPLRLEDYYLLDEAREQGFSPQNFGELKKLCRRLWVKSLSEREIFNNCFDDFLGELRNSVIEAAKPETSDADAIETVQKTGTSPEFPQQVAVDSNENQDVSESNQGTGDTLSPQIDTTNSTEIEPTPEIVQAVPTNGNKKFTFIFNKDYFPIKWRQMQQSWRRMRVLLRVGSETELDIFATIKQISQTGFLLSPVFKARRVNQVELLLLLDQSNFMMPFAPLTEQLIATSQQGGRLGETKVYYFSNILDQNYLFTDVNLLKKESLSRIISHLHKNRTVVLIFSDGGAALGSNHSDVVAGTQEFLNQIRAKVKQIAWLNPVPKNRWFGSSASKIANYVSMYPFNQYGWTAIIDILKGKTSYIPEDSDYLIDESDFASKQEVNPDFSPNMENLSPNLSPTREEALNFPPSLPGKGARGLGSGLKSQELNLEEKLESYIPNDLKNDEGRLYQYESAVRDITYFARKGQAYLDLACHAAFPLAITPDLVYSLRKNFRFGDPENHQSNSDISWMAIPDLLLSNICRSAGYQLYEMDSAVRHLLLKLLLEEERFGKPRLNELSEYLINYLQQELKNTSFSMQDFGENPKWIALAYTEPNELAKELALQLTTIYGGNAAEKVLKTSLVMTFAETLVANGFQPLLTYSRGWGRLTRGYTEGAEEIFQELGQKSELDIAGVKLTIPRTFTFDVVTVNAKGKEIKREKGKAQYFVENLRDGVTLDMVAIPGGTFTMGAHKDEAESEDDERPQHPVTVPAFFMGKYPVTQAQWRVVANFEQVERPLESDPSNFKGDDLPVESISWDETVEFCARLSKVTGKTYRLPSEAEWEYACRAGTTTPFHFGETITPELANFDGNYTYASAPKGEYRKKTTQVGSFKLANAFGLYDMHGNVYEWCADWWDENYNGAPNDGGSAWLINNDNRYRLLRGGSWSIKPKDCRSTYRFRYEPFIRNLSIGFRVVVSTART
ncbi:SUMF1/EgtB/PvdO family nonheme iron enzyme [Nodularia sphaerocarpa]|uniref:SUMF1/EgtB/PvdO family nonheme iron enzyme n=1 Tax=Nodularia sphaerocarpa TaxID=137816 RepID=UPI001EFA3BD5|nr:SUMF1/EgtB/PvdO family nonheme iron enzyme [Nodularia sphaerocarpa]MDB9374606.1 SUMF1/EgtB/PvdO family nonheme iron enzyme [Nodularia sphaerocarpa CS-585]MDB9379298.1 SUMF1/EgtB/PvdO family nonheme iron enzyme [Nodularia sphaerocarpa CS-585A2]ULP73776.1 Serine/threonine-protein kinase pkn1 [Nodularia sphaerocarpa UHCC 0038]